MPFAYKNYRPGAPRFFFHFFEFQEVGIRKSLSFVVVAEKNFFCLVWVRSMIDFVADFKSSNCENSFVLRSKS